MDIEEPSTASSSGKRSPFVELKLQHSETNGSLFCDPMVDEN